MDALTGAMIKRLSDGRPDGVAVIAEGVVLSIPEKDLAAIAISSPVTTVVANVTAAPVVTANEVRESLAQQVTGTVRWTPSIEYILDQIGCDLCLELGPGQVLAGLVGRIRKGTRTISIGDAPSLEAALPQLLKVL